MATAAQPSSVALLLGRNERPGTHCNLKISREKFLPYTPKNVRKKSEERKVQQ